MIYSVTVPLAARFADIEIFVALPWPSKMRDSRLTSANGDTKKYRSHDQRLVIGITPGTKANILQVRATA
jgi:hypothetical protein